jgi:hypothetical protein
MNLRRPVQCLPVRHGLLQLPVLALVAFCEPVAFLDLAPHELIPLGLQPGF